MPVLWVRVVSYRLRSRDGPKRERTSAELGRNLSFLESGLGWLCFRLGRAS